MMQELTTYQKSFQRKPKKPHAQPLQDGASVITEMLKSIPYGEFCNAYYIYESHWEGLSRILHKQTFIKEAEEVEEFLKTQASNGNYLLPPSIRRSIIPQIRAKVYQHPAPSPPLPASPSSVDSELVSSLNLSYSRRPAIFAWPSLVVIVVHSC